MSALPSRLRSSHGRAPSTDERRRVAVPRPSTKGPLDADVDDPLSDPASTSNPTSTSTSTPGHPPSNLSPSSPPPSASGTPSFPPKDFTFLLAPANFHPVPTTDIPPAFLNSGYQPPLNTPLSTLLARGQFRPAAVQCARALTTSVGPTDYARIFSLFYTRLSCLALINQHGLAAQEVKALGDLSSAFYRHPLTDEHIVPWELRVLAVRLMALGYSDWRKGIMGYYELARDARRELTKHHSAAAKQHSVGSPRLEHMELTPEEKSMWEDRLYDLGIRVASLLVEMGDLPGAIRHLQSLHRPSAKPDELRSTRLTEMQALAYLRVGDLAAARECISLLPPSSALPSRGVLDALLLTADGDYTGAVESWQSLLKQIEAAEQQDITSKESANFISHNLSLTLLYTATLQQARTGLEELFEHGPPYKTLLFNLATVYELCTEQSRDKKKGMAESLATTEPGTWGEGFDAVNWEWGSAGEFKL